MAVKCKQIMEDDTPLTALTAVTAFPEHIINETVYGQESFRTPVSYTHLTLPTKRIV